MRCKHLPAATERQKGPGSNRAQRWLLVSTNDVQSLPAFTKVRFVRRDLQLLPRYQPLVHLLLGEQVQVHVQEGCPGADGNAVRQHCGDDQLGVSSEHGAFWSLVPSM